MEEDIKVLKEYLDKQDRKFVSEYRLMILQAIENLIARNKELEKLSENIKTVYMNGFYDGEKKWKDKIGKHLEELDDIENDYSKKIIEAPTSLVTGVVQYAFRELLEERN